MNCCFLIVNWGTEMRTATTVAISVNYEMLWFSLFLLRYSTCNDGTYEGQEDVDSVLETDALVVDLHGAMKSCGENIGLNNWCDVISAIWHLISHLRTQWTCQWLPQPRGHKTRLSWDKLEEKSYSVAASTWRQQYDTMQPFRAFIYLVKLYSPKFIK